MEEIKNSKGKPIGVQISIFDGEDVLKELFKETSPSEEKASVTVKVELNAEPVKQAVDDLMEVITKHELATSLDKDGNLVIHLGELITDNINVK